MPVKNVREANPRRNNPKKVKKQPRKKMNVPRAPRRLPPQSLMSKLTPAGREYLKCALASPDFSVTAFSGIPDQYSGRVLTKRYETTMNLGSLPGLISGNDLFLYSSNVPGVAFFWSQRSAGSLSAMPWKAVVYPDTTTLLPTDFADTNVQAFRFASSQIEIVPLVNEMTWTGSIQVFRGTLNIIEGNVPVVGAVGGTSLRYSLIGDDIVNSVKPEAVCSFNEGAYSVARNTDSTYPFHPIRSTLKFNDFFETSINASRGSFLQTTAESASCPGFGTSQTVMYKIPAWSATTNIGLLRAWACVEYQVNATSSLYDYSHMSPQHDPLALELYNEFVKSMPSCVPYKQNANFWKRFLDWVDRLGPAVSTAAGGIRTISNAVESLL